jgi:hypothetical protein
LWSHQKKFILEGFPASSGQFFEKLLLDFEYSNLDLENTSTGRKDLSKKKHWYCFTLPVSIGAKWEERRWKRNHPSAKRHCCMSSQHCKVLSYLQFLWLSWNALHSPKENNQRHHVLHELWWSVRYQRNKGMLSMQNCSVLLSWMSASSLAQP